MRALALTLLVAGSAQAATHPFGFDDMARLGRLGDYDVSRDGKWVVYTVGRADVDENRTTSGLWLVPVDRSAPARRLTAGTKKDREPRFSPDGKRVAFISDRDGAPQIYLLELAGGEPQKLTAAAEGAHGVLDHQKAGYLEELLRLTGGQGVDGVLEMLANVNLGKDLTVLAQGGRVVVIGSRGTVEINPRDAMARDAAISLTAELVRTWLQLRGAQGFETGCSLLRLLNEFRVFGVAGGSTETMLEVITSTLKRGDEVRLVGFGNFSVTRRKASTGRNPRTGEPMQIAASSQPKFRPGKVLKDAVQ